MIRFSMGCMLFIAFLSNRFRLHYVCATNFSYSVSLVCFASYIRLYLETVFWLYLICLYVHALSSSVDPYPALHITLHHCSFYNLMAEKINLSEFEK